MDFEVETEWRKELLCRCSETEPQLIINQIENKNKKAIKEIKYYGTSPCKADTKPLPRSKALTDT
jgi:hypothetical protein